LDGVAYNLRSPADIAGTYGAAGAGLTFVGGAKVAQLQNENGVIIQVHGVQIGFEVRRAGSEILDRTISGISA